MRMKPTLPTVLVALVAGVVLATSGCTAPGTATSTVTTGPTTVGVEEFAELVEQPGTVVVDVRTPAEFQEGHLPGAVNLDVAAPGFADAVAGLDPDGTYAVYCRSGNRSEQALEAMAEVGITRTAHLADGIIAWDAAGGPTVAGS